jgi:hypothetical protein
MLMLLLQYVEKLKQEILENLRHMAHAPGVAMHEAPPDNMLPSYELVEPEGEAGGMMDRLGKYAREHGIIREHEEDDHHDHFE